MAKPSQNNGDLRINYRIRAREIRVIDPEGRQLGIMPPELAMQKATEMGLDLVEISPDSRPPVCRIMDYGKFKYAQKKKSAEARKNQASMVVKEVKFRPKIEEHDFLTKVEHIKRFLSDGHKTKVTMMFRGREITHQEIARRILERVVESLKTENLGTIEQMPKLEGRNMIMVVAPNAKQ
ncbi:MAG: translation initiation factor IF-3 [Deltaproteobacteria bacterium]|nr:translation initiation factor IF-3 [Deltaproteobacteria bacterium]